MTALPRLRRSMFNAFVVGCMMMASTTIGLRSATGANTERAATAGILVWETPPGWTDTRGGHGGKVLCVTTLAATGAGSLAAALSTAGPRIVEFAVAGTIDLGGKSLVVSQPYLTIAGETAATPGITLVNGGMNINAHDVIVRHIKIRPGAGSRAKKSGWEIDGLATGGGAHDVIVDHCSLTWSTDENLSASGPRFSGATPDEWRKNTSHRVTFSHCIIGEGLHDSTHAKGPHSMGSLIHDNTSDIAIIGNLYISNNARNPLFKGGARGAIVNNVIHNPGNRVMAYVLAGQEWEGHRWVRGAMVIAGNIARHGASTTAGVSFLEVRGPCDVHLADNLFLDTKGKSLPATPRYRDAYLPVYDHDARGELRVIDTPMFWPPRLKAKPAGDTAAWVLANAGARPWDRDPIDRRLIEEAKTGAGKIIHFESEVGGHATSRPGLEVSRRLFDSWKAPVPPRHLVGNLHYVGAVGVSSFLITTPAGHVLLDTGFEETVPIIQRGVEQLGFKVTDIKFLLSSHAHNDHTGGHARMQKLTGATIVASAEDARILETGGEDDFSPFPAELMRYRPAKVGRIVSDGDTIAIGGLTLTAHLTPGHTRGATTWTTVVDDGGKPRHVVFFSSVSIVGGTQLLHRPAYPKIVDDYHATLAKLKSLRCDIWFAPHGGQFAMAEKFARLDRGEQDNPFIDPSGWKTLVATAERAFREQLARETAALPASTRSVERK